jgi:hypothetical protein
VYRRRWLAQLSLVMACALIMGALSESARAEPPSIVVTPAAEERESSLARRVGLGSLGFVSAFVAHEAGHVAANLLLGNVPVFDGLMVWGFVPFFAIAPRIQCDGERCIDRHGDPFEAGRRGKYFIVSAGFNVQHLTDEIILSRHPDLRHRDLPFHKGMLLFNVFLSALYITGEWTGLSDPHGDLGGMRQMSGFDGRLLSLSLLVPAALDTYRYFAPQSVSWAPWVSRGSKAAFVGLTFTF